MSDPLGSQRLVVLGRVARAHGISGAVRIESYSRSGESFAGLRQVWLKLPGGESSVLGLKAAREHSRGLVLKLVGVATRDEAESLVGAEVAVPRSALPELEEGEYYWFDLIGLEAVSEDGSRLGRVKALFETGANDVLVIDTPAGEVLLPAAESVVTEVDLAQGRLKVRNLADLGLAED